MDHKPLALRLMNVVNRQLLQTFPSDAGSRCMYGAYALAALFREASYEATVVGGDFAIFIPSHDNSSAAFHGFGGSEVVGTLSHYWVESGKHIVDPSPLLLHMTTTQHLANRPVVYWPLSEPFPRYLRYIPKMKISHDAEFSTVPQQCDAATLFTNKCRQRLTTQRGVMTKSFSVLDGKEYIFRTKKPDTWTKAAKQYETNTSYGEPPL